jgi:hypothetical protein
MKIEVVHRRDHPKSGGGIDVTTYDDTFMRRMQDYIETENKLWQNSDLRRFHQALRDLVDVIERVCPKEGERPFEVVIRVEGEIDNSPGPRLY